MASKTTESKDDYKTPSDTTMDSNIKGNEIITLSIGAAGTYILNEYYQRIMEECKINKEGIFNGDINNPQDRSLLSKSNTQFITNQVKNKYIPRAIFLDLDCSPIDEMRSSFYGNLMAIDNFISSPKSIGSMIWAQGHYTEGAEFIDEAMDKLRNSIEICDNLQGFQLLHGISGGCGGGWGTLLLVKVRDSWPDKVLSGYNIFPSRNYYDERNTNLVTYNTVLAIHQLIENMDLCFMIDNGQILNGLHDKIGIKKPNINDINWLISLVISTNTAPYRFDAEPALNVTMKRMFHSLTPFPRLKFFGLSISPFISPKISPENSDDNINKILNEALFTNDISDVRSNIDGKILSLHINYRSNDNMAIDKMDGFISNQQEILSGDDSVIRWIPQNVHSCYISDNNNFNYDKYSPILISSIISTTAIKQVFQRMTSNFAKVYRRKGYLHWYKGEGMDEMEFQEADRNMRDLIAEYQDKQDVVIPEQDDEDNNYTKPKKRNKVQDDRKYQAEEDDEF